MKKSAFISDLIFTFSFTALFTLCVFRYLRLRLFPALALSIVCGLLTACALGAILQSKRNAYFLKRSDNAIKEKLTLHLALASDRANTELFFSALAKPDTPVKKVAPLRLQTNDSVYFFILRFTPVRSDDVAPIMRVKTTRQKILVCLQVEESALALCQTLNIQVKTGDWAYAFLKEKNCLPPSYLGDTPKENRKKRRLQLCFSKHNSKRFLTSATLILLFSFVTPFSYYYLVFGVILLLTALFIRIFGYA